MLMILQVKVSSAKNGREREREEEENGVHKNGEIEGEFLYHSLFRNLSYATRKRKTKYSFFFFAFESRRTIDHSSNSSVDRNCSRGSYIYRYSSHGLLASLRYNARMVFDPLLLIVEELLCEHKMIFVYVLWHPLIACGA